jgi:hypothetical protein
MSPLSALCEFALTYRRELPDFICEQTSTHRAEVGGRPSVTVSKAQVTYQKGHEYYSNVTIDGKRCEDNSFDGKRCEDNSFAYTNPMGFVSVGEFGSDLVDLFKPPIVARLKFRKIARLRKIPSAVYEFEIAANKNTFWMLRDGQGATVYPELKGELWLNRQSGRLLRLELQTPHLPQSSEFRMVDITIDYEEIQIANAGTFLLPSQSQARVCMLGPEVSPKAFQGGRPLVCTMNSIVFDNCRKFVVKTHIVTDSQEH